MVEYSFDDISSRGMLEACFFGFMQPYDGAMELMHSTHELVTKKKICNQLLLLEHEPVITITRQHLHRSIKTSPQAIADDGITLALADRGGDATFHGPGQLIGYPIIALNHKKNFIDISCYIRSLETALLHAMHQIGVHNAQRLKGFTGIWVPCRFESRRLYFRKLIAIGVGVKNGVTKHGFAINISIDHARYSEHIVPCGLKDRGVITLQEYFSLESLEMPEYWDIVKTVSHCLSRTFALTLAWRT